MGKSDTQHSQNAAHRLRGQRTPASNLYSNREYERRLTNSGRRMVSLDLDSDLVSRLDGMRGKERRGLIIDTLLKEAIAHREARGSRMT
ncbi:hypothetical protein [Erythrobacter aureus]|uniref:hypothetical protein n=1 Tax=Erythrobacter aureus TaxID=2182384 RepID=UPI0013B3ED96|nr:hypothetical protein [Erythrobacter aureus]